MMATPTLVTHRSAPLVEIVHSSRREAGAGFEQAAAAFSRLLGRERVRTEPAALDPYARSTGVCGTRPRAILFPQCTGEVQEIVRIAQRQAVPLYPISMGRNWGYGDACAPSDGQVIVDLGQMNRIVEINDRLGYAVLEPGVTQQQLADYLRQHHPGLMADCTGAGPDASLVGNTLDRGFGHTPYADHCGHTCGMEVVLADGRLLHTGFGHFPNSQARHVFPYGVGPMLDGLFAQSNLGIVTRIGLWLMPRPETIRAFFFTAAREEDLADIVDRLTPLRQAGLLRSAVHLANDVRVLSSRIGYPWQRAGGQVPLPPELRQQLRREHGLGSWNGCGAIYGTQGTVAAVQREVRRVLAPYRPLFIEQRQLAFAERLGRVLGWIGLGRMLRQRLQAVRPVFSLLNGQPSTEHLQGVGWRVRGGLPGTVVDPRDTPAGLMWVSPVLPASGDHAREVMDLISPIYQAHGFDTLATFTMLNERALVCVTNIAFDKRFPEERARAAACYDALLTRLLAAGYIPYRTGPQGYAKLWRQPSVFWDVARQIKQALDPQDILSPGRYIPAGSPVRCSERV